jgi:hypothetical protein
MSHRKAKNRRRFRQNVTTDLLDRRIRDPEPLQRREAVIELCPRLRTLQREQGPTIRQ